MKNINYRLLHALNEDEKVNNRDLYSAGSYWKCKTLNINDQLKKKGLENFRGYDSGVGTSYCDNVVVNVLNEEFSRIINPFLRLINKLPILNRNGSSLSRTQNLLIAMHQQKLKVQENLLERDKRFQKLLDNFKIKDTTRFGCVDVVSIDGRPYSLHYLELANTLAYISKKIDLREIKVMLGRVIN